MILFRLLFYLCSLILLHLSLLLASLVALFSPYLLLQVWIVFSSVYALCAQKVISSLKFELLFFGGRLPFSSLRLFLFFSCFPWCRCAELVFGALVSSTQSFVVLRWHERLVCACLVCEVLLTFQLVVVIPVLEACVFLFRGDSGLLMIILSLTFLVFWVFWVGA